MAAKKKIEPAEGPPLARQQAIAKILEALQEKFTAEAPKATLADFIRLLQLERELKEEEQPREIVVRWVDPETA